MQADNEPPGHTPLGAGVGTGGVGAGGVGAGGVGTGGVGTGGGLQRRGSGPCTTLPVSLIFLTVYFESYKSP